MLADLQSVLATTSRDSTRETYVHAITHDNCLAKLTSATRQLGLQRLSELYGLDPQVPIFRVMRRLWDLDTIGRAQLALLCALARDPLLCATAEPILSIPQEGTFARESVRRALQEVTGGRLNDATLDKVVRNTASTWTQTGHLEGRTFKKRKFVRATGASAAFAMYLANISEFHGSDAFSSGWFSVLDCSPSHARELVFESKRLGILDVRMVGDVFDVDFGRLNLHAARS
jgi:hypothetical protein